MNTSIISPLQKSLQPLGRDVVVPSSIQTEKELCKEDAIVLMALLDGLLSEVMSSDILCLAMLRAKKICEELEISEERFSETLRKILVVWEGKKKRNPLSSLF